MSLPGHAAAHLIEHRARRHERHAPSELLRDARRILHEPHRPGGVGASGARARLPRAHIVYETEGRLRSGRRYARLGTNQPVPVRLHVDHPPWPPAPDLEESIERVVVDALEELGLSGTG